MAKAISGLCTSKRFSNIWSETTEASSQICMQCAHCTCIWLASCDTHNTNVIDLIQIGLLTAEAAATKIAKIRTLDDSNMTAATECKCWYCYSRDVRLSARATTTHMFDVGSSLCKRWQTWIVNELQLNAQFCPPCWVSCSPPLWHHTEFGTANYRCASECVKKSD